MNHWIRGMSHTFRVYCLILFVHSCLKNWTNIACIFLAILGINWHSFIEYRKSLLPDKFILSLLAQMANLKFQKYINIQLHLQVNFYPDVQFYTVTSFILTNIKYIMAFADRLSHQFIPETKHFTRQNNVHCNILF